MNPDIFRYDYLPPDLPVPWIRSKVVGVGGLAHVGFAPSRDLLLVGSPSGLSLYDTLTGCRLARDYDVIYNSEQCRSLLVPGFDIVAGQIIAMAGIWGGGLRRQTADGFYLSVQAPNWPDERVVIECPEEGEGSGRIRPRALVLNDQVTEVRAYGFSDTGQSFVIATASDLYIYSRSR